MIGQLSGCVGGASGVIYIYIYITCSYRGVWYQSKIGLLDENSLP